MAHDKDERKRSHLRLVVSNPERMVDGMAGEEEAFITLEELLEQRDELRPRFYAGMEQRLAKAHLFLEDYLKKRGCPYGLDPYHGRLMILPAVVVCPEVLDHGGTSQDELLLFVAEDLTGLCISLEIILPYYSDDQAVMEDALLYGTPLLRYGTLFLEENRQDGYLDLIYRLSLPIYPPALTGRILDRLLAITASELAETLCVLGDYPG